MYRIDTTNNSATKPAYTPIAATPGYFQDTEPAGGTDVPAEWLNHYQEELCNTVTGLGGTLDKTSDNVLWTYLAPRVEGIFAHETDTEVYTNPYRRVVIASEDCQCTGANSVIIGCEDCTVGPRGGSCCISCDNTQNQGVKTAAIASHSGTIGGAAESANIATYLCTIDNSVGATFYSSYNANLAAYNSNIVGAGGGKSSVCSNIATHDCYICNSNESVNLASIKANIYETEYSIITSSRNVELHTDFAIGGGYDSGAAVVVTSANQNLTWLIESKTGDVTCSGDIRVGDPNLKTATDTDVFLDAANGNIGAKGGLNLGCTNAETGAGAKCTISSAGAINTSSTIDATGLITASAGIKTVTPAVIGTTWDSGDGRFEATANVVGGFVELMLVGDSTVVMPAGGPTAGVVTCRLTNSKIGTGTRVHATVEYAASATQYPVVCVDLGSGYIDFILANLGSANIGGPLISETVNIMFDVINPV